VRDRWGISIVDLHTFSPHVLDPLISLLQTNDDTQLATKICRFLTLQKIGVESLYDLLSVEYLRAEHRRKLEALVSTGPSRGPLAVGQPRREPDPTIIARGDRQYSIGDGGTVVVGVEEDAVLTAFLKQSAMETNQLKANVGYTNPGRVIRALQSKYGGRFAPAIVTPGRKGKGGYQIRIRRAE